MDEAPIDEFRDFAPGSEFNILLGEVKLQFQQ